MQMRISKPTAGNLFYITASNGGWSNCIQGSPRDSQCNVMSNCVGYACGRFNEIIGSMKYPQLNCNAENFIERAQTLGLQISQTPSPGAIMVWRKGVSLSGNDGAGHVAIVERVDSANQVLTSESAYGGSAFYNKTRTNSNGRWGLDSTYVFRGFVVNPAVGVTPLPSGFIGVPVKRDTTKRQVEVLDTGLRGRSRPELTDATVRGFVRTGIYNILEERAVEVGIPNTSNGYVWYKIESDLWISRGAKGTSATSSTWTKTYEPSSSPTPPTSTPTDSPEKMLDISTWQDSFDASIAKQNGISTVICRCGYGSSIEDNKWDSFSKAVIDGRLKLGTYGFSTWHYDSVSHGNISTARLKMKSEIDSWVSIVGTTPIASWFALDMELESGQSCSFNKSDLTSLVNEACDYIEQKGFKPCVYSSASWFDSSYTANIRLNTDELRYPIWIAWYYWSNHPDYNDESTPDFTNNGQLPITDLWCQKYANRICAWQFGSQGYGNKYGVGSVNLDKNWLYFQPGFSAERPTEKPPEATFDIVAEDITATQKEAIITQMNLLGIKYTVKMD